MAGLGASRQNKVSEDADHVFGHTSAIDHEAPAQAEGGKSQSMNESPSLMSRLFSYSPWRRTQEENGQGAGPQASTTSSSLTSHTSSQTRDSGKSGRGALNSASGGSTKPPSSAQDIDEFGLELDYDSDISEQEFEDAGAGDSESDPEIIELRRQLSVAQLRRTAMADETKESDKQNRRIQLRRELAKVEADLEKLEQRRKKRRTFEVPRLPSHTRSEAPRMHTNSRPGPDEVRRGRRDDRQASAELVEHSRSTQGDSGHRRRDPSPGVTWFPAQSTAAPVSGEPFFANNSVNSKLKSGLFDKAVDHVESKQSWPHLRLGEEYPGKGLTFHQLDFTLFVAGELEIISDKRTPSCEAFMRMQLLKMLAYINKNCDWETVRDIYVTIINKIETGTLGWDEPLSSFRTEVQWVVSKRAMERHSKPKPSRTADKPKSNNQVWPCRLFNKGSCSESKDHAGRMNNKDITWKHVCLQCYQNDKLQKRHREGSSACPHAGDHQVVKGDSNQA